MICLKPSFCFTLRARAGSSRASSTFRLVWKSKFFCAFNVDLPAGLDGLALQEGSLRPDQGRHLPEERRDAVPAERGLLADLLAIDGLALPRDLLPHADQVLLRRPLLSSRCSRWHRVPRPRRVDGATCHAIDARPHAGGRASTSTKNYVSTTLSANARSSTPLE